MNFDILFLSSFKEYLDHVVSEKLGSWTDVEIPVFETQDSRLPNYKILSSGDRQWVYDSGITTNIVKSSNLSGGWEYSKIDYTNSRIILPPGSVTTSDPMTVTGAAKRYNSYLSSSSDQTLLENTGFNRSPEMLSPDTSQKPYNYYAPCYFIKLSSTENDGFEVGSKDKVEYNIKVTYFTNSEFERICLAGVFRDLRNKPSFLIDKTPLDEFNDLKVTGWSYIQKMDEMLSIGQNKFYITDVRCTNLSGEGLLNKFPNSYIGIANFKVFVVKSMRQYS